MKITLTFPPRDGGHDITARWDDGRQVVGRVTRGKYGHTAVLDTTRGPVTIGPERQLKAVRKLVSERLSGHGWWWMP